MHLDVPTLMLIGAFVASVSGALLLYAWYQYGETHAALWWSGADAALAAGIVLAAVGSAEGLQPVFFLGMTFFSASATLTWAGTRSFDNLTVHPAVLVGGTLLWLIALFLPLSDGWTALPHALILSGYYGAAAWSMYRSNADRLQTRLPLVLVLLLQALSHLLAIPGAIQGNLVEAPPVLSWLGLLHFETLVFLIGTTLFLVTIMKERNEQRLSLQSSTDSLTGLLNRRGFVAKAERMLDRARQAGSPASVIVFDLDRFKTINDRFGHATGDRVLQVFAESCRSVMRPGDITGRIGGEEFAAVLPGFGVEAGFTMAERVRKAFAVVGGTVDGQLLNATVSAGIAATRLDAYDIDELLRQADGALYRAKERGRNRVETAAPDPVTHPVSNIIRVA